MLRIGVSPVLALLPLRSTGPSQKMPRKERVVVVVAVSRGGGQVPLLPAWAGLGSVGLRHRDWPGVKVEMLSHTEA